MKTLKTPVSLRVVRSATEISDGEAFARVAAGERSALGVVFDRHSRPLLQFAMRVAGRADAEDVVQTTFERATSLAASFDREATSARPWLFAIASRVVLERRRAFARFAAALARLGSSAPPPSQLDTARLDVLDGLERLAPAKRVTLVLAEIEGYRCEEIARMLDVPVGTVWTRLHHARTEMRAFLAEGKP
ncbi:MAG: RNA polymerase sigma factor [Labilithrix sp.]|nr:RNA polymerase sigma factor [Labilithrix sp.]